MPRKGKKRDRPCTPDADENRRGPQLRKRSRLGDADTGDIFPGTDGSSKEGSTALNTGVSPSSRANCAGSERKVIWQDGPPATLGQQGVGASEDVTMLTDLLCNAEEMSNKTESGSLLSFWLESPTKKAPAVKGFSGGPSRHVNKGVRKEHGMVGKGSREPKAKTSLFDILARVADEVNANSSDKEPPSDALVKMPERTGRKVGERGSLEGCKYQGNEKEATRLIATPPAEPTLPTKPKPSTLIPSLEPAHLANPTSHPHTRSHSHSRNSRVPSQSAGSTTLKATTTSAQPSELHPSTLSLSSSRPSLSKQFSAISQSSKQSDVTQYSSYRQVHSSASSHRPTGSLSSATKGGSHLSLQGQRVSSAGVRSAPGREVSSTPLSIHPMGSASVRVNQVNVSQSSGVRRSSSLVVNTTPSAKRGSMCNVGVVPTGTGRGSSKRAISGRSVGAGQASHSLCDQKRANSASSVARNVRGTPSASPAGLTSKTVGESGVSRPIVSMQRHVTAPSVLSSMEKQAELDEMNILFNSEDFMSLFEDNVPRQRTPLPSQKEKLSTWAATGSSSEVGSNISGHADSSRASQSSTYTSFRSVCSH